MKVFVLVVLDKDDAATCQVFIDKKAANRALRGIKDTRVRAFITEAPFHVQTQG